MVLRKAIIVTGVLETNYDNIWIKIQRSSLKKIVVCNMSVILLWHVINVLKYYIHTGHSYNYA